MHLSQEDSLDHYKNELKKIGNAKSDLLLLRLEQSNEAGQTKKNNNIIEFGKSKL